MAVKSFPAGVSVTAQTVFNAIVTEVCGPCISNVFSIMAYTTSLNSGKKSGVNKRLVDFFSMKTLARYPCAGVHVSC